MCRYLPKCRELSVAVVEQISYRKMEKAVKKRQPNEMEIYSNGKITGSNLCRMLTGNCRLVRLSIFNECDRKIADTIAQFLPNSQLTNLEYARCQLADDDLTELFKALPKSKIKYLDLSENHLADLSSLSMILKDTNITFLGLADNYIDEAGVRNLSKGLVGSKLKSLDLENNPMDDICELLDILPFIELESLYEDGDEVSQEVLIRNLPKSKLKELRFGLYVEYMSDFLLASSKSKLESCCIYTEEGDECCEIIKSQINNFNFKKFKIDSISGYGVYNLSSLIHTNLQSLDLENCPIEDEGMHTLSLFLPHTKIQNLYLNECGFTDIGISLIVSCWSQTMLVHLEMRSELLTNSGVQLALHALSICNPYLRYLDVSLVENVDIPAAKAVANKYPHMTIIY
ncbi:hypothetical protein HDV06_002808 [Boothiomyces sp. JEL0866]|nr:hypothetical protein HDV06_002808 [Boothiomyces sp. JEL0866]